MAQMSTLKIEVHNRGGLGILRRWGGGGGQFKESTPKNRLKR